MGQLWTIPGEESDFFLYFVAALLKFSWAWGLMPREFSEDGVAAKAIEQEASVQIIRTAANEFFRKRMITSKFRHC